MPVVPPSAAHTGASHAANPRRPPPGRLAAIERRYALDRAAGRKVLPIARVNRRAVLWLHTRRIRFADAAHAWLAAERGLPHNAQLADLYRRALIAAYRR